MIVIDECLRLSDETMKSVIDVVSDAIAINLTVVQATELLRGDKYLAAQVYLGAARDTDVVEQIINTITKKVLGAGQRWPMYGDSPEFKQDFDERFKQAAPKMGYSLSEYWN